MKLNDSTFNFFFTAAITISIYGSMYFIGERLSVIVIIEIFLISYPWKLGNHIFSIFGGQNSGGNVTSLFSVAQYGEICVSLGPSILQRAESGAFTFLGFACIQESGKDSGVIWGGALYQKSERNSVVAIGLALFQQAQKRALVGFGIPFIQRASMIGTNWGEVWKED